MIISSSLGICSTVYAGIRLICTHTWNVIAVVLHILGFPTDRCCAAGRSCISSIYSIMTSCCSSREQSLQTMPISTISFTNRDIGPAIPSEGRTRLGGIGTRSILAGPVSSVAGTDGYAPINQEVWWKLTTPNQLLPIFYEISRSCVLRIWSKILSLSLILQICMRNSFKRVTSCLAQYIFLCWRIFHWNLLAYMLSRYIVEGYFILKWPWSWVTCVM